MLNNDKKIYIISFLTILCDIISKLVIINNLHLNEEITIINNFFSITYVRNTGIAFSFLSGNVLIVIIITLLIGFLFIKYLKNKIFNKTEIIAYGLISGGAIGNLIDRIVYGYVIDFFEFKIFNFPIFNIADIAIVIGVILLIIYSIFEKDDKNEVKS